MRCGFYELIAWLLTMVEGMKKKEKFLVRCLVICCVVMLALVIVIGYLLLCKWDIYLRCLGGLMMLTVELSWVDYVEGSRVVRELELVYVTQYFVMEMAEGFYLYFNGNFLFWFYLFFWGRWLMKGCSRTLVEDNRWMVAIFGSRNIRRGIRFTHLFFF